jgi:hypothetical protein
MQFLVTICHYLKIIIFLGFRYIFFCFPCKIQFILLKTFVNLELQYPVRLVLIHSNVKIRKSSNWRNCKSLKTFPDHPTHALIKFEILFRI